MVCLPFEMVSHYGLEMDCELGTDKSGSRTIAWETIVTVKHEVLVADPSMGTW